MITLANLEAAAGWIAYTANERNQISAVDRVQLDRLRFQVRVGVRRGIYENRRGDWAVHDGTAAGREQFHRPSLPASAGRLSGPRQPRRGFARGGQLTVGEADASGRTFRGFQGTSLWRRLFEEGPILNLGVALERELGVAAERPGF
jgi:hypothetical protein